MNKLAQKHLIGGECLCWAEYIRDGETLEQRLAWPKYAAKAERLWLGGNTERFKAFVKRLKGLYPYMKALLPRDQSAEKVDSQPGTVRQRNARFCQSLHQRSPERLRRCSE